MASTESTSNWRDIERRTKKSLSIETSPTPDNIAKCNQQSQSPLFGILPAEIRNDIFSLALLQYEDVTQPYPENDYCYRPGHRAQRIVSTELLLTCRRIWLEANHWPMEQAVHSFWFDNYHCPEWTSYTKDDDTRFRYFVRKLSSVQRLRIKHIQVSTQMYWLEDSLLRSNLWGWLDDKPLSLDTFTVTIRHTDWWNWEADSPLQFDQSLIRKILRTPEASHIVEFRLELETLEWNVGQLRVILDDLRSLNIHDPEEESDDIRWELVESFEETTWSGPTKINGEEFDIYAKRDKLDYRIVTVKWRRQNPLVETTEQRWRVERSLLKFTEPESESDGENGTDSNPSWSESEDYDEEDDEEDDDDDDDEEEASDGDDDGDDDSDDGGDDDADEEEEDA